MEGQLDWQELKTLEHVSSFKMLFDLVHVYFLRGGGGRECFLPADTVPNFPEFSC